MWKKIGIGCGIVALLGVVIVVLLVVFVVPKAVSSIGEQMSKMVADEQERQEIVAAWTPPDKGASAAEFFPASAGAYQLRQSDEEAAIPELAIDAAGLHASYANGPSEVAVYAYPVSKLEAEALLNRVAEIYKESQGGGGVMNSYSVDRGQESSRLYIKTSELGQNHLWFVDGWLMVFRASGGEDTEPFVRDFLRASGRKAEPTDPVDEVN